MFSFFFFPVWLGPLLSVRMFLKSILFSSFFSFLLPSKYFLLGVRREALSSIYNFFLVIFVVKSESSLLFLVEILVPKSKVFIIWRRPFNFINEFVINFGFPSILGILAGTTFSFSISVKLNFLFGVDVSYEM